jgi:hypothetical protein
MFRTERSVIEPGLAGERSATGRWRRKQIEVDSSAHRRRASRGSVRPTALRRGARPQEGARRASRPLRGSTPTARRRVSGRCGRAAAPRARCAHPARLRGSAARGHLGRPPLPMRSVSARGLRVASTRPPSRLNAPPRPPPSYAYDGFRAWKRTLWQSRTAPGRWSDQVSPPSSLRRRAPASIPTRITPGCEGAIAISWASAWRPGFETGVCEASAPGAAPRDRLPRLFRSRTGPGQRATPTREVDASGPKTALPAASTSPLVHWSRGVSYGASGVGLPSCTAARQLPPRH